MRHSAYYPTNNAKCHRGPCITLFQSGHRQLMNRVRGIVARFLGAWSDRRDHLQLGHHLKSSHGLRLWLGQWPPDGSGRRDILSIMELTPIIGHGISCASAGYCDQMVDVDQLTGALIRKRCWMRITSRAHRKLIAYALYPNVLGTVVDVQGDLLRCARARGVAPCWWSGIAGGKSAYPVNVVDIRLRFSML